MNILDRFTLFAFNYPATFCLKIWADNPLMANHLNDKFNECLERYGASGAMVYFYRSLDGANRQIFENYLINEYDAA
jgi:spore coat polysaccharide biosynthesis protein SpsF (cytidylyltransferase family)